MAEIFAATPLLMMMMATTTTTSRATMPLGKGNGNGSVTSLAGLQLLLGMFAAVAVAQAAKFNIRTHDDAVQAHEECREANHVPDDIYEKFLNYEFPDHRRTKCYVKCFVEKMGLFTERKGFIENAIIAQFTTNNFHNLEAVRHGLEKCIDHNEAESDVCTWANRVFSCWLPINRHVVRKIYG
ncbi:hypothetical protein ACLKA6_008978 [Drosophila palustris]